MALGLMNLISGLLFTQYTYLFVNRSPTTRTFTSDVRSVKCLPPRAWIFVRSPFLMDGSKEVEQNTRLAKGSDMIWYVDMIVNGVEYEARDRYLPYIPWFGQIKEAKLRDLGNSALFMFQK
ncbi:hypothetical protein WICPIJ_005189 [Wickerhamomyces pijperi]|uniref:Uncharacterized protein n=1 Tax=Wickerhamomyces pijperi TaxID=599730 RepID=A0A9P8Q6E1_WICPI|nr:hypothetical protein WICPIJ_005189 [Wickerhamomyces pijperi]